MTDRREKFTPGPLFIETVHVGDEKWDEIRDKDGNFISESGNYWDTDPEPNPDSILQQHAPDLYYALKDCAGALADLLEQIENGEKFDNVTSDCLIAELQDEVEKAVVVLKKARGEE